MKIFWDVKEKFQETLLIPINLVARTNHNEIRNKRVHSYLNNAQKINPADKGRLHQ